MLDKNGEINQHIKGIDACSSEIACRPEVFGQVYRYLASKRVNIEHDICFHNYANAKNLQMTYHVGEDFFDITDGLRAIDEVLLFCNFRRGNRLGHEYIKLVRNMQDKMINELAYKGIGIETNPSSNYLIGTIRKYEEHPILRFNSRKLKEKNVGENICVSINTDDQGVFDTLLENEYALMTLALKKATDDDMNTLYDIEDIYEWIDYVRKMGINQIFS